MFCRLDIGMDFDRIIGLTAPDHAFSMLRRFHVMREGTTNISGNIHRLNLERTEIDDTASGVICNKNKIDIAR